MLRIYSVVLDVIRSFRPYLAELRRKDPHLADQLSRALTTVALSVAEGSRSRGKNRPAHYARGAASMDESISVTDVAAALGLMAPLESAVLDQMRHIVGALVIVSR